MLFRSNRLSRHLQSGALRELTVTTNGSQLTKLAPQLAAAGIKRINVSVDSLKADRFREITRRGDLDVVLAGIKAARDAGIAVKINAVALKGVNDDEYDDMIRWCAETGSDMTLIETMPMGEVDHDRTDHYLPLSLVRARLSERSEEHTSELQSH